MSKTKKVEEKTYNQRAIDILMNISKRAIADTYHEAFINQTDVMDLDEACFIDVKDLVAEQFDKFLAEYVLYKLFGKKNADEIFEPYHSTEMSFDDVQNMIDALDAGNTIAQIVEGDY